jgi:hypothetical protein
MTKILAKEIALEMWSYLRDHTEIDSKKLLPSLIYNKSKILMCDCALCEVFPSCAIHGEGRDNTCPLFPCVSLEFFNKLGSCLYPGAYWKWVCSLTEDNRKEHASNIVEMIEKWDVTNSSEEAK